MKRSRSFDILCEVSETFRKDYINNQRYKIKKAYYYSSPGVGILDVMNNYIGIPMKLLHF
tara:strand:- start:624 stop:803 length:180 start_codon:yes stop_codon:yes gene_type:complete